MLRISTFLFVVLTAGVAVGCSTTTSTGATIAAGPNCTALADKCPYCTDPGLTQTCKNAVASEDESSCAEGLADKDVQSNCVASSASGGTNPSGGTTNDSGTASSNDSGNGTGPVTTNDCPAGHCVESCNANASCNEDCTGGNCTQTCGAGGNCVFACSGGNCTQACAADAQCNLTCNGGNCHQDCSGVGDSCVKSCDGDNCT